MTDPQMELIYETAIIYSFLKISKIYIESKIRKMVEKCPLPPNFEKELYIHQNPIKKSAFFLLQVITDS